MYGCESWTTKTVEWRRTGAFELWFWRRLLRVSWIARRSNQSIPKEISPEYSLKDWRWSSNTLAIWWEELTHWKRSWSWERLKAGGEGDDRGWDGWMAPLTQWTWVWASFWSWWWTGKPGVLHAVHGVEKSWTRLSDWTDWLTIWADIRINLEWKAVMCNGDGEHMSVRRCKCESAHVCGGVHIEGRVCTKSSKEWQFHLDSLWIS